MSSAWAMMLARILDRLTAGRAGSAVSNAA